MITITGTKQEVDNTITAIRLSAVCWKSYRRSYCSGQTCEACIRKNIAKEYTDDTNENESRV